MANPGTALTSLWVGDGGQGKSQVTIKEETSGNNISKIELEQFLRDRGLEGPAYEGELIAKVESATTLPTKTTVTGQPQSNNKSTTVAGYVTALPRPIIVSQPVLLPKIEIQHQQALQLAGSNQTTPTIVAKAAGLSSPASTWHGSSTPGSRKRRADLDQELMDSGDRKRRRGTPYRNTDKGGKGLRHFSMKVCEKVQQKRTTTYNEVADELVQEFSDPAKQVANDSSYDQKNIRRRVYDALNVLMAMNIISKEKKEIKWVGLPTNSAQECAQLEETRNLRIERIKQKQLHLHDLILQQIAFKNLVERNKQLEKQCGVPSSNAAIHLPFIIVNTSKKTVIDCSISGDKSEYLFNFDNTFEIHDDIEVLKRMGLTLGLEKGQCSQESLRLARSMVPKALEPYVRHMASGSEIDLELPATIVGGIDRPHSPVSPLATPIGQNPSSPSTSTMKVAYRSSRASSVMSCTSDSNRSGLRTRTPSPSYDSGSGSEHELDDEYSHDGFVDNINDA